ncbi:unnamed protein product [Hymenolepis diminuta]|uniref:Cell division cycle protein 123 homolog n=1 Tax=Hymenolepis diminuta TaxID=6216 RepID=A0A0R3SYI3_HYMDI|nr:unnamed protein product [Hymenolepis diminuta]VUZ51619.1 unnamed protein product [Hymenolepis diminuta]
MNKSEIIACAFESWYSKFEDITINSVIMDLPDEVLEYIKTAPLVVPKNAVPVVAERDEFSDDSDEESWSDGGEDGELESTTFPEFEEKVNKIIGDFNGEVFPKLNWSSPKDVAWINFGSSLKCTKASDVLVLLKASDFIGYDIYKPFYHCTDLNERDSTYPLKLVLRRWYPIRPDGEFRCFIRSNHLVALCQRHHDSYYSFIETEKDNIKQVICNFFDRNIKEKFPLENYVMDVFVNYKFKSSKCVMLIDFNVYGPPTDGLLFDFDEVDKLPLDDSNLEFRWQTDKTLRSGVFSQYKLPIDLVDISVGNDPEKLMDLIQAYADEQKKEEK